MSYDIGPKIGIDGEAEFRKALQRLNAEYKTLQAQTKAVTAEFDANGDQQGKLMAVSKQLEKQIEVQKQRQEMLRNAVEQSSASLGENSEVTVKWQRALYECQATTANLEKELQDTRHALDEAGKEMSDFTEETDDASDAALGFGDVLKANLLSDAIMAGARKLGDLVGDFAGGMIGEAASFRASTAQFEQTFGSMATKAKADLESLSTGVGISVERMQGSYTKIFAFAKTVGTESGDALGIASRAMVAAADSAAYYDRSIEDVTETLQSFIKGNYENDAALGISCTEITRNTAANERYAKSFKDLTEAQKIDVLLGMVEAANQASGAMGQAARESDAWENVTGELENSWKKLQAKLGEPVLANTIPIIQKVTDKLDEAGNSKAFDRLAEGISNTFVWMIDNGPAVVRASASIAAAIVTFSVATKAAGWLDKLTASTKKLWVSMTAHPIGLVAAAVTGLIAAIALAPEKLTETQQEMQELTQAAQDAATEIRDISDALSSSVGSIDLSAGKAEEYLHRLDLLAEQGLTTAAAQTEYNATVDLLRTLLPDLNLQLDEQTGLLKDGTDSIRLQINAWKDLAKAEVYAQKYKAAFEAVADVEVKLTNAQEELRQIMNTPEFISWATHVDHINRQYARGTLSLDDYTIALVQAHNQFKDYQKVEDYTKAIQESQAAMAAHEATLEDLEAGYLRYNSAAQTSAKSTADLTESVETANQAKLDELAAEYEDLRLAAKDSIDAQIGLFDDLSEASSQTFDELLAALESQQNAFNRYADNLTTAIARGIDQGLVQKLSDGSVESMMILDTLVNGTDEQIAALNDALGGVEEGRSRVAATAAYIQMDWQNAMAELVDGAYEDGRYVSIGFADGIAAEQQRFVRAIRNLSNAGQQEFREVWSINSPSAVAADMSHWIPIGAAQGVDQEADAFLASISRLYTDIPYALDYSHIASGLSGYHQFPTSTQTVNVSLGGVNVSLSAPPGTDLPALAQMVADTINETAIRRAIAYG